jgi:glycosyltransferase involved in cell wall biosynthesis
MPEPKISVIVAVYNGARFITECLDSLWQQTWTDFECIVLDDGSTDETPALLAAVTDPRLRVLRNDVNQGVSAARNRAIAEARGEYLAILDADDLALPERFSRQVEFLDGHADHAIVGCFFELRSEAGNARAAARPVDDRAIRRSICLAIPFVHSGVMMRSSAFRETAGYDVRLSHGEDYRLFADILVNHKGANLTDVLVIKRETMSGLTFRIPLWRHVVTGLSNRLYVARRISPTLRGYLQALAGAGAIVLVRGLGLNREKLRRLMGKDALNSRHG